MLALFDRFVHSHAQPGFRGCPFTNSAAELPDPEHPAKAVMSGYKIWMRQLLVRLSTEDSLSAPESAGNIFAPLVDCANARVITTAMSRARQAAAHIITTDHG